jgi:hypothetical protein
MNKLKLKLIFFLIGKEAFITNININGAGIKEGWYFGDVAGVPDINAGLKPLVVPSYKYINGKCK